MNIGDKVKFTNGGLTLTGVIVNMYAVPKDYDLIDVKLDGVGETIIYGLRTDEVETIKCN